MKIRGLGANAKLDNQLTDEQFKDAPSKCHSWYERLYTYMIMSDFKWNAIFDDLVKRIDTPIYDNREVIMQDQANHEKYSIQLQAVLIIYYRQP